MVECCTIQAETWRREDQEHHGSEIVESGVPPFYIREEVTGSHSFSFAAAAAVAIFSSLLLTLL